MSPVFELSSKWVAKFFPASMEKAFEREKWALSAAPRDLPVEIPELVGTGDLDSWHYIVSTRLPGSTLLDVQAKEKITYIQDLCGELAGIFRLMHQIPYDGPVFHPPVWSAWIRERISNFTGKYKKRLPPVLLETFDAFVKSMDLSFLNTVKPVFLHGDMAPENLFMQKTGNRWEITGFIDFGNAMVGDALFDYAAPGVLMGMGKRDRLEKLLKNVLPANEAEREIVRKRLMLYTLLHPLGDMKECFDLVGVPENETSWDAVTRKFWNPALIP